MAFLFSVSYGKGLQNYSLIPACHGAQVYNSIRFFHPATSQQLPQPTDTQSSQITPQKQSAIEGLPRVSCITVGYFDSQ